MARSQEVLKALGRKLHVWKARSLIRHLAKVFAAYKSSLYSTWYVCSVCLFVCPKLLPCSKLWLIDWLFIVFRHTQQFFSYPVASSFYWWRREPRHNVPGERPGRENWQTFSHNGTAEIRTRADRGERSCDFERNALTTQPRRTTLNTLVKICIRISLLVLINSFRIKSLPADFLFFSLAMPCLISLIVKG